LSLEDDIRAARGALLHGEVVGLPTETFYGLAVDALDVSALARLLALKGRGAEKAISLLVTEAMLDALVADISPRARALMAAHWPGALTLALPASPGLPEALVSDGCVAVRCSPHPVIRSLLDWFGFPITATSANPAGAPPPTTAAGVRAYFPDIVVVDGGETPGGKPSTLARVRGEMVEILRAGAVTI
jgi:L-threonylcarbamoyladenylate synthase